jgi:hypothetical protein
MDPHTVIDLTKDRIERHVKAMGGPVQQCECHGNRDANRIVDGVALCELTKDEDA